MKPLSLVGMLLALLALAPRAAHAQSPTAGAFTIGVAVATQPTRINVTDSTTTPSTTRRVVSTDFGGVAMADLWAAFGPVRLGGALGVAPMTSEDAGRARVLLPFGLSVALSFRTDAHVTFDARLRGGIWAGATNYGIAADAWASLGLWIGFELGGHATLFVGADFYVLRGQTNDEHAEMQTTYAPLIYAAPGLSISWLP